MGEPPPAEREMGEKAPFPRPEEVATPRLAGATT